MDGMDEDTCRAFTTGYTVPIAQNIKHSRLMNNCVLYNPRCANNIKWFATLSDKKQRTKSRAGISTRSPSKEPSSFVAGRLC